MSPGRSHQPLECSVRDAAAELRGVCGMGLAAGGHPRAALTLAQLLADPEPVAR